jgi:hypothetical protein
MENSLRKIENLRNQIAHGGAMDTKRKEYPHLSNLPNILKNGKAAADEFLTKLGGLT